VSGDDSLIPLPPKRKLVYLKQVSSKYHPQGEYHARTRRTNRRRFTRRRVSSATCEQWRVERRADQHWQSRVAHSAQHAKHERINSAPRSSSQTVVPKQTARRMGNGLEIHRHSHHIDRVRGVRVRGVGGCIAGAGVWVVTNSILLLTLATRTPLLFRERFG
jgi:hypothetical protein